MQEGCGNKGGIEMGMGIRDVEWEGKGVGGSIGLIGVIGKRA